jgi:hypothetical protein
MNGAFLQNFSPSFSSYLHVFPKTRRSYTSYSLPKSMLAPSQLPPVSHLSLAKSCHQAVQLRITSTSHRKKTSLFARSYLGLFRAFYDVFYERARRRTQQASTNLASWHRGSLPDIRRARGKSCRGCAGDSELGFLVSFANLALMSWRDQLPPFTNSASARVLQTFDLWH